MAKQSDNTLKVVHLPPQLSDVRRYELFEKYGAVKTRTIRKSAKYSITFVEFPSKELATDAFHQLHQLEYKGRRLSVEFANRSISLDSEQKLSFDSELDKSKQQDEDEIIQSKLQYQKFMKKLNTWAPHHLLSQPVPPYLKYKYPPPTKSTLLRIAIQLVKEPALYTQVLHLMNKMNIPPPFEDLEEEFPMVKEAYDIENYRDLFGLDDKDDESPHLEEGESEWESENEAYPNIKEYVPQKRKKAQSKKRIKIPKFFNPLKQTKPSSTKQKSLRPQDVFERIPVSEKKNPKIELKTDKSTIEVLQDVNIDNAEGGFGLMYPANKQEQNKESKKQEFITSEQLAQNRLSENDQRVLTVFKNYHPGKPSNRLYIKNLAKQVQESDLDFIYKRYILPTCGASDSEYNIRLMQEGRMKGQAFIILQNQGQAQLALNETNGYILKDKPMVVQFAKVHESR